MKENLATKGHERVDRVDFKKRLDNVSPALRFATKMYVEDKQQGASNSETEQARRIDSGKLTKLSDVIANAINSIVDLDEITPYISKARIILKTLILYPNGARENILNYGTRPSAVKNAKLHTELLNAVKEYFTNDYKIEERLDEAVEAVTVGSGSYIVLNITRPALDNLINGQSLANVQGIESFSAERRQRIYIDSVRNELQKEFVKVDGDASLGENHPLGKSHFLAKNKGLVRDPSKPGNVGGLESLWENALFKEQNEVEFSIFGKDSGITLTDNLSTLVLNHPEKRMNEVLSSVAGNEGLLGQIAARLEKSKSRENEEKNKGSANDESKDGESKDNRVAERLRERRKHNGPSPSAKTRILDRKQRDALDEVFRDNRSYDTNRTLTVKRSAVYTDDPYGRPLNITVPSSAFIQCHLHGDPKKRRGGFIIIDENGQFANKVKDAKFYYSATQKSNSTTQTGSQTSTDSLISQLRKIQQGGECDIDMTQFARLAKIQIQDELKQAVASGSSGENISVELEESALMLFLERSFERQRTRVLYVPEEYFTYVALNYNRLGFGVSFTMKARHFIGRLAALDVADALAQLENAQTRNEMVIALEEHDTDPYSTIAMARTSWFKTNPTIHNLIAAGVVSLPDIVDAIREQMLVTRVEKGPNRFFTSPNIQVNQIEKTGFKRIDDDSRQYLLSQIANTLHIPKAWLDERDDQNNFQIEALAEQELLKNQTVLWQDTIGKAFGDICRKHIWANGPLKNLLIDIITENMRLAKKPDSRLLLEGNDQDIVAQVLTDFVNNLTTTLTEPATMESVTKIRDKIDLVTDIVEKWVESSSTKKIGESMLKNMGIDTSKMEAETMETQIKALFTNKAMRMVGVPMPYDETTAEGEAGGMFELFTELEQLCENNTLMMEEWVKMYWNRIEESKDALEEVIKKLPQASVEGEPGYSGGTSDGNTDFNESSGGSGEAGGDDPFSMGDGSGDLPDIEGGDGSSPESGTGEGSGESNAGEGDGGGGEGEGGEGENAEAFSMEADNIPDSSTEEGGDESGNTEGSEGGDEFNIPNDDLSGNQNEGSGEGGDISENQPDEFTLTEENPEGGQVDTPPTEQAEGGNPDDEFSIKEDDIEGGGEESNATPPDEDEFKIEQDPLAVKTDEDDAEDDEFKIK